MARTRRSQIEGAKKELAKYNQLHLLQFVEELSPEQQETLLEQVESLDFEMIQPLIESHVRAEPVLDGPHDLAPPPAYPIQPSPEQQELYQKARARGEQLIAEHKVAAFVVAGGAGTRLNYDGPKGNVPATPLRNKSLFRVFAEYIQAVQNRYNCVVPWYVMTSQANHAATQAIFQENDYYGLDPSHVMHFPQGMMPVFGQDGKILLEEKGKIALSPDGHGGSLRALYNSGAVADMEQHGIEYISYFQVDNPLVHILDPLFIGLHALDQADMSSKAVIKCDPLEKVGNFVLADGRLQVIEYSDMPEDLARLTDESGRLVFEQGSIAIHVISRKFVERLNKHGFSLPWHRAVKRVSYIDSAGNRVEPEKPNAVKLETFVFDALPLADKSVILSIDRDEEFAPIKNAAGVDSLESSQQLQVARAARWFEQAGFDIPRKPDSVPDLILEISPLFALNAETLVQKRNQLRSPQPGEMIYLG